MLPGRRVQGCCPLARVCDRLWLTGLVRVSPCVQGFAALNEAVSTAILLGMDQVRPGAKGTIITVMYRVHACLCLSGFMFVGAATRPAIVVWIT